MFGAMSLLKVFLMVILTEKMITANSQTSVVSVIIHVNWPKMLGSFSNHFTVELETSLTISNHLAAYIFLHFGSILHCIENTWTF